MKKKLLISLLFTVAFLFLWQAGFSQNLLTNGDMESWTDANTPTGWTKYDENITKDSTYVHTGTYSAQEKGGTAKSTLSSTKKLAQIIPVTGGSTYTISLWYYVASGDGTDARIWSNWIDGNGASMTDDAASLQGPNNAYFTSDASWQQYSVTLTAPASASELLFEVRVYGSAIVYWDDLSVTKAGGGGDTQPPTWTTNFPKVTQVEDTRFTLLVNMSEAGKAYYVVVASGATAPTSAEVKAGVDYGSTTVLQKDTVDVAAANTTVMANITGAQPGSSADIYVVAEDASGNLQSAPVKISVTTTAARSLTIDKPQANATFYLDDTIKIEWTSANIDSLMISVYPPTPSGISVVFTTGPVAAADGSYNLVIPQNADAGNFRLVLWDAYDSSFKKEVSPITLADNRQLHWVAPLSGDTVYVGDTAVFKWTSANIDSVLIGGYIAQGGQDGGYFMLTGDIDHYDQSNWKPVLASKGVFKFYLDPKNMGGSITLDSLFLYDAADTSFKDVVHPVYILDTFPLQIQRAVPTFGMTDFPATAGISCDFNSDSIIAGSGYLHLRKADGTTVENVNVNMVNIRGNSFWFMPNPQLVPGQSYYIEIDSGFVKNAFDAKVFGGLKGKAWSFTVASNSLYFSEYEEGSRNNKALEIYNPTNHDINLDEYIIGGSYNGSGIQHDVYHFPKGYILKAGAVFVLANSQANSAILSVTNDTLAYNEGGYVVSFNGNDARALGLVVNNGKDRVLIDQIGNPWESPASGWDVAGVTAATKDHTLLRKGGIMMGTTDWGASAGTDASSSQWIVKPKNYSDNLGKPTSGVGISNPGLADNISVYPNPGNGRMNITLNNVLKGNVTVRVMDITGREVYRHVFNNVMNQTLPVNISNEPSNLYFITISDAHNTVVKKFMKR